LLNQRLRSPVAFGGGDYLFFASREIEPFKILVHISRAKVP
jgi:hypothetical protein